MTQIAFDIPDGMTAQVIVGTPDAFARRELLQLAYASLPSKVPVEVRPRRQWLLMSSGGVALLLVGMVVGGSLKWHTGASAETASLVSPPPLSAPYEGPPPARTAFPAQAPSASPDFPSLTSAPTAPPATSGEMPPDLAASLNGQPQVKPAPGQAPGQGNAPPAQNAFGLGG